MNEQIEEAEDRYQHLGEIDFSIIATRLRSLSFFEDDVYLGMQAINCGVADVVITQYEYSLLQEYFKIEKTPLDTAMTVSALSQMWVFGLYEVLRLWRERKYQFAKLYANGGIDLKIENLPDDDPLNLTIANRKGQLLRYKEDGEYRKRVEKDWDRIETVYRMVELYRINLAKHCSPGKGDQIPRAPGYGRINMWCGAMDYELIEKDGYYTLMNRRDIADALRGALADA